MPENISQFLKELKSLLLKYNAVIDVEYADCSDMHGVYDQHMTVSIGVKTVKICDNWGIAQEDIKIN